ncbi:MAG: ATP-binding protein, partial [Acidobacteriaceae bacterium]|nr:ATP-binding protein [Acidobacteriaceae bacterium]
MKRKALISWSSGKDSAWTLHVLRQSGEYEIAGLLTTMNAEFDRVAMHGTRRELVEAQAEAAGVPLITVPLLWPCSNEHYESAMKKACARAAGDGVEVIAFGDLFLEDVRRYREEKLAGSGLMPVFPLWGKPTRELVREMLAA